MTSDPPRRKSDRNDELTERVRSLVESEAYRLVTDDPDFLELDELRSVRLQLEYLKPERMMQKEGVRSTVVVFGSARLSSRRELDEEIEKTRSGLKKMPSSKTLLARLEILEKRKNYTKYYDEAQQFASIVSRKFQTNKRRDFVVVTGGGPGIMEAANRGADDVGARSIGLNIDIPKEQAPNAYITENLCFRFRYFALRKLHFLVRARALVAFPGGFGTLDELFEVLTLIQTGKMQCIPVILFGSSYWSRAVDFDYLANEGFIAAEDLSLFEIVDSAEDAMQAISRFYKGKIPEQATRKNGVFD